MVRLPNFTFFKQTDTLAVAPNLSSIKSVLSLILSGIKEPVLLVDTSKNIVVINHTMEQLLSVNTEQVLGKGFDQVVRLYLNKEDITSHIWASDNFLDNLKLVSITGVQTSVKLTISIIHNVGWVITLHDINLERQIEEMKMGFVSLAAHELRTPLTALVGYLSIFIKDYQDQLNADEKDLLARMQTSAKRLMQLIENLLNVSRVERGTTVLNMEKLDLAALSRNTTEEFHDRAAEKGIELKFVPPTADLPIISVDRVRITEVLSNLISNAINYNKPGGKVHVWVEMQGQEIITHVADNGAGIPQEAIPHLFTKFYRVNQGLTQNQNTQGNGLGLYITKSILDMHKGRIWVHSQLGKGSVFSFALPIS